MVAIVVIIQIRRSIHAQSVLYSERLGVGSGGRAADVSQQTLDDIGREDGRPRLEVRTASLDG